MIKKRIQFILPMLTLLLSSTSNAACVAPTPPDAPNAKPSLPICMMSYKSTGTHNCSSSETDNYIDTINKYMKTLSTYAGDAISYANAVQQFANCSAEEAKEGLK